MGTFAASLKTMGDRQGLPATIHLEDGRLTIDAGEESIGEWALSDISLEPTPTGYRMAAEGEQILIELTDVDGFESELTKKSRGISISLPAKETLLKSVDKGIAAAEKKWGSLLPDWVFTRIMFGVVFGALILALIFPGWVSTFLLLAGLLVVVFGAVVYSDPILIAKWLPGRMAPVHVLLFGVSILMFGVLLGVIAN